MGKGIILKKRGTIHTSDRIIIRVSIEVRVAVENNESGPGHGAREDNDMDRLSWGKFIQMY
jgi:hypothetical protein